MSSFGSGDKPTQANHFSDVANRTEDVSFDDLALVGVEDPISINQQPCPASGAASFNHYGLSQIGANRWARGNRCGIDLPGELWSVQWTRAEQILFHYFTRVHLRDANNDKQIISPAWRWNPLKFQWKATDSQPPVLRIGSSYQAVIQIQNTGIYPWQCIGLDGFPIPDSRYNLRYFWSSTGPSGWWQLGKGEVSVCDIQPGDPSPEKIIAIDDIPTTAGHYILHFDINDTVKNSWFRSGGWPTYDVEVQVVSPVTPTPTHTLTPTPTSCGFDGC